ncbi:uncharacterized protein FPRN_09965 [Fusarium proliferatum]|nr:uncharacterized protein FPRN_09965 [Fusarium proliferatum]
MDELDIRTLHDIKGHGRNTACSILTGRPPSSKDIAASPGLACLIVVLRHIYAHLLRHPGALPFLDWLKSSEKENPILRVAWHPFGDEPEEVDQATKAVKKLIEELSSKGFSPDEAFYTLCESSLMRNTLWSHPSIRVVLPPAQANMGSQNSAGSYLHADMLEFHPAQKPGQSLQSFADELFETTTARPPIIRILYHSDEKQPIDLNGLRSFRPPASSEDTAFRVKKYMLLTIVRLNDTSHKNDYVRAYSILGPNFIAEYEPPSFMAHRWSVKDAPVKYILIYGLHESQSNDLTDFDSLPEIATYRIAQEDVARIRRVDDYLNSLRPGQQTPGADSTTSGTNVAGGSEHSVPEYKDRRISSLGLYFPKSAWNVKENSPGYGSDRPYRE